MSHKSGQSLTQGDLPASEHEPPNDDERHHWRSKAVIWLSLTLTLNFANLESFL